MTTISYISPLQDQVIHPRSKKQEIKNPADIFLGKPTINFIDTKYRNVVIPFTPNHDDLFLNLRIFLVFGRCIGLVPIEGLFQKDYIELNYRKSSFPALLTALIAVALGINAVVGIISLGSGGVDHADDYAWAPAMFVFYGTGTYMYTFFYRYSEELISLIYKWNNQRLQFTAPDKSLFRNVNVVAGLILTSAILENAVAHFKLFPFAPNSEIHSTTQLKESKNTSAWEVYFIRSHGQWANLVPFHIVLGVYVFICNKFALYAWNYMDVLIVLLARVVYFKFKAVFLQGQAILLSGNSISDAPKWRQLTKDHEILCGFLYDLNKFLSPLIFISYGNNIYYICLQLNLGLNPSGNTSLIASIYALWSFLHLIARVYFVSVAGARINDWAHKISDLFRKCPNEAYITEVERAERFVSANTIGLNGLGCFIITKPLLLHIVGVVFTFEIVLLQATQTPLLPLGNSTMTHN